MSTVFGGGQVDTHDASLAAQAQAEQAREQADRDQQRWEQEQLQLRQEAQSKAASEEQQARMLQAETQSKAEANKRAQDQAAADAAAAASAKPYSASDAQLNDISRISTAAAGLPGFNTLKNKVAAPGGYLGQSNSLAAKPRATILGGG